MNIHNFSFYSAVRKERRDNDQLLTVKVTGEKEEGARQYFDSLKSEGLVSVSPLSSCVTSVKSDFLSWSVY